MFQLREREDVQVETTDVPGVLEIRRMSSGATRWTHRVDVAAMYAERLTAPEVFAIDARFGAGGELHVIVHAFDGTTRRLLPPRELSFLDGPRLDRTRLGADRHALEPNEYVIAGGIHWQVTDETATTFTLADGRTIPKTEATGPFLRLVPHGEWTIRIVQELDNHVLAVIAGTAATQLGWSTGLTTATAGIGFRWFGRGELGHLEPPPSRSPCLCAERTGEQRPGLNTIAVERADALDQRLVECGTCLTTYALEQAARDRWTWTPQARRHRDGTPAELLPDAPVPAPVSPAAGSGPVPRSSPRGSEPDGTQVDKHAFIHFKPVGQAFVVTEEGINTIKLDADGQPIGGDKLDPYLSGPFLYWVRYDGVVLRVIDEDHDTVLLVCHPSMGPTLRFARAESHSHALCFKWVWRSDVEDLRAPDQRPAKVEQPPRAPHVWPATAPALDEDLRRALEVHSAIQGTAGRIRVTGESTDAFTLSHGATPLLALKGDPAFTGEHLYFVRYRDHLIRVARELPTHVLAIAHPSLGNELGFAALGTAREELTGVWLPRTEVEVTTLGHRSEHRPAPASTERDRPPTESEANGYASVQLSLPESAFVVYSETATHLELLSESQAPDEELIAAGFSCEQKVHLRDYEREVSYYHLLTIDKLDRRVAGGFLYWVRHANALLRVVAEADDRVLVVCSSSFASAVGFEIAMGRWHVGWAWLPRARVERVEAVRAAVRPALDLDRYEHTAVEVRLHGFGPKFSVMDETPDTFTLQYEDSDRNAILDGLGIEAEYDYDERGGRERQIYTLECAKTDPRLAVELVEYRGYQLRVIERHPYGVLAAVRSDLADLLGFSQRYAVALRWLAQHEVRPVRPRGQRIEPGRRRALLAHMSVGFAPRGEEFVVRSETADTIVLDSVGPVPKPDGRLHGNNLTWVRHAGRVLRVAQREGGEVLAVAHRDLASDTLPQLDANLCAGWIPVRDVEELSVQAAAPVDPDVGRLAAVADQIGGHDRVAIAGFDERPRIVHETGNTLEVEHASGRRETFGKADVRLRGPFTHLVGFRGVEYRVVLELDGKYLVVIHDSFPEQYKFMRHPAAPGLFRWFDRMQVGTVERVANAATEDLSLHAPITVTIDGVIHRCPVKNEFSDVFDVELGGDELRIDKLDPRVGGTFERIGFYEGMQIRVIGERDGRLLVVVDDAFANRSDGWERGPGLGWRLVAPDRVTEPPPSNDALFRSLKIEHAGFDRGQFVVDETADAFVLETGTYAKSDPQLVGVRLAFHQGTPLRVADTRGKQVLVVAAGALGKQPGFTSYSYDGRTLGWAWIRAV